MKYRKIKTPNRNWKKRSLEDFEIWRTPDYKEELVELDITETSNIPFYSLKGPDFRNVILKILEVSSCDPQATVHSPFAHIRADWLCAVAGESQEDTSRILRITFLKSGRFSDQNDIYFALVMSS